MFVSGYTGSKQLMNDKVSDSDLVAASRKGDRDAYRTLVERYHKRVFSLAFEIMQSREDAEDVTQEAFVKAYLSLRHFKGDSTFYTWLYRIAYNMAIDLRRKHQRRGYRESAEYQDDRTGEDNAAPISSDRFTSQFDTMMRKEEQDKIRVAMAGLSEDHRTVIVLREVDGLSYDEIADMLGISKGTVMSRLFYARKRLQKELSEFAPAHVEPDAREVQSEQNTPLFEGVNGEVVEKMNFSKQSYIKQVLKG